MGVVIKVGAIMKRYISAILIPCLLLQLCGCYSFREMTLEELKNYKGEDDIMVTKKSDYFVIMNRDSTRNYLTDWMISDSSIIMEKKPLKELKNAETSKEEKTEIKFNQIKSIAVEEWDSENTIVLIVGLIGLAAIIGLVIYGSIQSGFSTMQF